MFPDVSATADDLFGDASDISSDEGAEPPPKPEDGEDAERVRKNTTSDYQNFTEQTVFINFLLHCAATYDW